MTAPGQDPAAAPPEEDRRAVVVFSDRTDRGWLRVLRRGFRHCFVLLERDDHWLLVDALSHRTEVTRLSLPAGFDMTTWYRAYGHRAIETRAATVSRRPAPWAPFTCVESVKRLLGIRRRRVLTPWALQRHLLATRSSGCHGA